MKIGIITEFGKSFYNTTYPALREEQPWLKKLVQLGYEVRMLCPIASKSVMEVYNNHELRDNKLQEWYTSRIGVIPTPDGYDFKPDVLIVTNYPWATRFNYQTIGIIQEYAKKTDKIIWKSVDYEYQTKSIFWNVIPKFSDIYNKISVYITNDILCNEYNSKIRCVYLPHTYDPQNEIPIKAKSTREYLSLFCGPVSHRKHLAKILPDIENIGILTNMKSIFYREKDSGKHKADIGVRLNPQDLRSIIPVKEAIYLTFPEFIHHMSNCLVTYHDNYIERWQIPQHREKGLWHTGKITEAGYSGVLVYSSEYFGENVYYRKLSDFSNTIRDVIEMSDGDYSQRITEFRRKLNYHYGIDKWFDVLHNEIKR